jgi:hypothetical protein
MSVLKGSLVLAALLFLIFSFLLAVPCSNAAANSQSQAVSALEDADSVVVSAYQVVSRADDAGANVTGLLDQLNEAGELLARAHAAYKSGDFDSALELADLCQERLNGFVADADALTEVAVRDGELDFLVNVVGSIAGSVCVVCGGVLIWFYLDRRYGEAEGQIQ